MRIYQHCNHDLVLSVNSWKRLGAYSALWLQMPWCSSTRPSVPAVLSKCYIYWTNFMQKYCIYCKQHEKTKLHIKRNTLSFKGWSHWYCLLTFGRDLLMASQCAGLCNVCILTYQVLEYQEYLQRSCWQIWTILSDLPLYNSTRFTDIQS